MGLIPEQDHLTVTDAAFEAQRLKTWPGMAHFAGSGPALTTCRSCMLWNNCGADPGYYAPTSKHRGGIKPRSCGKYQQLMSGEIGPAIPHTAAACKYFVLNAEPPKITERR